MEVGDGPICLVWDRINRKRLSESEKGAEDPLGFPSTFSHAVVFKHPLKISDQIAVQVSFLFPYFSDCAKCK